VGLASAYAHSTFPVPAVKTETLLAPTNEVVEVKPAPIIILFVDG
jgi:hypothetical protein